MACYFGCAGSNKFKWLAFTLFFVLGLAFLAAFFGRAGTCYNSYDGCLRRAVTSGQITRQEYNTYHFAAQARSNTVGNELGNTGVPPVDACELEYGDCIIPSANVLFRLWVLFWVLASIPLYMMCCCARRPRRYANEAIQMQEVPQATYAAGPMYDAPYTSTTGFQGGPQGTTVVGKPHGYPTV